MRTNDLAARLAWLLALFTYRRKLLVAEDINQGIKLSGIWCTPLNRICRWITFCRYEVHRFSRVPSLLQWPPDEQQPPSAQGIKMMETLTVGVVDAGIGNVAAIVRSMDNLNLSVKIVQSAEEVRDVNGIILPGVGSYDRGVDALHRSHLWDELTAFSLQPQKSILGICLGMQLLCKSSEEGSKKGLGILNAEVLNLSISRNGLFKTRNNDLFGENRRSHKIYCG